MRVTPPIEITDAMLVSSTAAEPGVGETTWTSGANFAAGDVAILGSPSSTVTITVASPAVVTWTANGLPNGTPVVLTTDGSLPTGLSAGQVYYVVSRATNTFRLAATPDGAPIVTTGSQSGTHTATAQVHRKYESLVGSNSGNPPAIDDGTKWLDIGPTNRWAMLDLLRNTGTVAASPLEVVLAPGERVNTIGLVGVVADEVTIEVEADAGVVYSYTQSLRSRNTLGWYDYFFGRFRQVGGLVRYDLPPYTNATITVTLTRASGDVSCGGVILGTYVDLGDAETSAESDALNFSVIDRDEFGSAVLIQRRSIPRTVQRVICDKSRVNRMLQVREELNAEPALWSSVDDSAHGYFEAFLVLGVYKRWSINAEHPEYAAQQIEIEEV
jgi:hypothetical protein